ncbi:DoxX family protein [Dickeya sp. NCPPB 3274]|uniref:DoxX family protein n=1 Tax=Dickeya sp. NCPPB 3274 TaxID=568766 RepID=UPI0005B481A0|nr:DoxX family protein [Dickeya sp. NCPPB 3274]
MAATYTYWISTALLSLLYFASAALYATKSAYVRKVLTELGYSASYLVPFMIVVKALGPIAILSRFNVALSDLAYAGILYHLILSGLAHLGARKPRGAIPAAAGLIFLAASFATQNVVREPPSPNAPAAAAIQARLN